MNNLEGEQICQVTTRKINVLRRIEQAGARRVRLNRFDLDVGAGDVSNERCEVVAVQTDPRRRLSEERLHPLIVAEQVNLKRRQD